MLSPEGKIVYDILRAIAGDGDVYKIVDADEIIEKLPQEEQLSKVQLSQVIRDLKDREYVDIKYFTPDEYCLRVLKRIEDEEIVKAVVDTSETQLPVVTTKSKEKAPSGSKSGARPGLVLFMSFLGGIIGSGFVAAVTTLVLKFAL